MAKSAAALAVAWLTGLVAHYKHLDTHRNSSIDDGVWKNFHVINPETVLLQYTSIRVSIQQTNYAIKLSKKSAGYYLTGLCYVEVGGIGQV